MVATRRSLPAGSSEYGENDEEEDVRSEQIEEAVPDTPLEEPKYQNKRVRNALRKLEINGTAALLGNRVDRRRTTGTYHYRGAVYDITADTPQLWIDQQPNRYRPNENETDPASRDQSLGKRTRAESKDVEDGDEEPQYGHRTKRRRRNTSASRAHAQARAGATTGETPIYHTRSAAAMDKVAEHRQRQLHERKRRNGRFTTDQRSELMTQIAAARNVAREKGYQVDPLGDAQVQEQDREIQREWCRTIVRLGRINSRVALLSKTYRTMKARGDFDRLLESARRPTTGKPISDAVSGQNEDVKVSEGEGTRSESKEDETANNALPLIPSCTMDTLAPHGTNHSTRIKTSPAKSSPCSSRRKDSDVAISIEQESKLQPTEEDSDIEPAQASDEALDRQIHSELASSVDPVRVSKDRDRPFSEPLLAPPAPTTAKKPAEKEAVPADCDWTPRLSEKRNDEARAENAIHRSRKQGEHPQALRRRVQRELALLRSWALVDKSMPFPDLGLGKDATVAVQAE